MKGKRTVPEPEYEITITNKERKALMAFIAKHINDDTEDGTIIQNYHVMFATL